MKNTKLSLVICVLLLSGVPKTHAQKPASTDQFQISSNVAESLLVYKEPLPCSQKQEGVRITGTVVLTIAIDKNGGVSHTHVISGSKLLRSMASATVRKYRYKPYLVHGTPVEVETVVNLPFDCYFHTGQA